jgi:hypothetical protein
VDAQTNCKYRRAAGSSKNPTNERAGIGIVFS